jgi:hypothetical protein
VIFLQENLRTGVDLLQSGEAAFEEVFTFSGVIDSHSGRRSDWFIDLVVHAHASL